MKAPYHYSTVVTCDIETTGLNTDKAELLSVAMICDHHAAFDEAVDPKTLPFLDVIVIKDSYNYFEPGAMKMNVDVIEAIGQMSYKKAYLTAEKVQLLLTKSEIPLTYKEQLDVLTGGETVYASPEVALFLMRVFTNYAKETYGQAGDLEIAGKNLGKFDVPVLRNFFNREVGEGIFDDGVMKLFSYRYLEVGSMYRAIMGKQVSLSKINSLFGRNDVAHKAYADALDTVRAIRLATSKTLEPEKSLEDLAKEVG